MKRFLAAGAILVSLAGVAFAQAPADQQACNAMADQLAEAAENKAMNEALMSQCEDNKLAEAGATADKIRAAIGG